MFGRTQGRRDHDIYVLSNINPEVEETEEHLPLNYPHIPAYNVRVVFQFQNENEYHRDQRPLDGGYKITSDAAKYSKIIEKLVQQEMKDKSYLVEEVEVHLPLDTFFSHYTIALVTEYLEQIALENTTNVHRVHELESKAMCWYDDWTLACTHQECTTEIVQQLSIALEISSLTLLLEKTIERRNRKLKL
jgi:hypothetical protein